MSDFSNLPNCYSHLDKTAERFERVVKEIERAKQAAANCNPALMDDILREATKLLPDAVGYLAKIRHERQHIAASKAVGATELSEGRFAPLSWDNLPEKPPAYFAVADLMTLAVVIHSGYSDWRQVSDLDRDKYLLYDISLIGKDNADYNWNLNATYPILVATPIAAAGA